MSESPKISIIIPVYNVENYVEKSIMSVLNQTYKNIEVIVVNDGSTDGSAEKVKQMLSIDERIRFIDNKENNGPSHARNVGLDNITGDYIGFVDADDTIDPTMYEKLMGSILKYNSEMAFCDVLCLPSKSKLVGTIAKKYGDYVDMSETRKKALDELLFLTVSPCNKIYKKEVFENIRYPEGKLFEDLVIYSQLVLNAKRISFVREKLYNYLIGREGSTMTTKCNEYYIQRLQQWLDKYREIKDLKRESVSRRYYLKLHREFHVADVTIKNQFNEIEEVLISNKNDYKFLVVEKMWMYTQKRRFLRVVFSRLEAPLKKTFKY